MLHRLLNDIFAEDGSCSGLHAYQDVSVINDGCTSSVSAMPNRINQASQNLKTGATERRFGSNNEDENISRDLNAPGTLSMTTGRSNSGGSLCILNVAGHNFIEAHPLR